MKNNSVRKIRNISNLYKALNSNVNRVAIEKLIEEMGYEVSSSDIENVRNIENIALLADGLEEIAYEERKEILGRSNGIFKSNLKNNAKNLTDLGKIDEINELLGEYKVKYGTSFESADEIVVSLKMDRVLGVLRDNALEEKAENSVYEGLFRVIPNVVDEKEKYEQGIEEKFKVSEMTR